MAYNAKDVSISEVNYQLKCIKVDVTIYSVLQEGQDESKIITCKIKENTYL